MTSAKSKSKKAPAKKAKATAKSRKNVASLLESAPAKAFPKKLSPMLATLVNKPVDGAGWLYEVKWDGYRALAFLDKGKVELRSRNDKSFNDKFYPLTKALSAWKINAVLDGEIVVLDESGVSRFGNLQAWRSEADGDLAYYVFDLLWYEGRDLRGLPLTTRKAILQAVLPPDPLVHPSEVLSGTGTALFEKAKQLGLEGIIAKKADSVYETGERSRAWLKIKAAKRQEMVIGGFTKNEDTSKMFSSLLVGTYENGVLRYAGKVGTGFNAQMQKELMQLFRPLITPKVPFSEVPDVNQPSRFRPDPPHATVTWLKPQLVGEVSYAEITRDGILRHPSFEGLRTDKRAKEVVLEKASPAEKVTRQAKADPLIIAPHAPRERGTLLNPTEATQVRSINGHTLTFNNLNKLYWPREKITKRDLLNYYYQVAPYILPYLKDRPQSMLRNPEGITGFSFYYKNVKGKVPDWIETYAYHSEADGQDREYLVAKDEASLLYMASLGCIEMNPWNSTVQHEDRPDWCIIDLDPDRNTFDQVIMAANVCREVLERMGIRGYPKTSGSTGMHIYIPLGAKYTYEQSREFGRVIARLVHEAIPAFTSLERIVKERKGKMYIDFLQNRPQATVSAPYSLRPKPGATVSMPLHWEEVKKGLTMRDFTIHNALDRIRSLGDIFRPVLGKGINMEKALRAVEG